MWFYSNFTNSNGSNSIQWRKKPEIPKFVIQRQFTGERDQYVPLSTSTWGSWSSTVDRGASPKLSPGSISTGGWWLHLFIVSSCPQILSGHTFRCLSFRYTFRLLTIWSWLLNAVFFCSLLLFLSPPPYFPPYPPPISLLNKVDIIDRAKRAFHYISPLFSEVFHPTETNGIFCIYAVIKL